jgi:hypothetical protein
MYQEADIHIMYIYIPENPIDVSGSGCGGGRGGMR